MRPQIRKWLLGIVRAWGLITCAVAYAGSVTLDGSLGQPASAIIPTNSVYMLTLAQGKQVGSNLFFSLGKFNLDKGEVAQFSGPNSVSNVLTRVTGGASTIDGTIQCTIPKANFFLINSAGVIFGPDAALDVQGSFAVTTADVVKLADGNRFTAIPSATDAVLTTAAPATFGFLSSNPAGITLQGGNITSNGHPSPSLHPASAGSLMVIGGNVTIQGGELATNGAGGALIVSVASAGTVDPSNPTDTSSFTKMGAITVMSGGVLGSDTSASGSVSGPVTIVAGAVNVSGTDATDTVRSALGSISGAGGASGSVMIAVTGALSISNGAELGSDALFGTDSGPVTISAGIVAVNGTDAADPYQYASFLGSLSGSGIAGSVTIRTPEVVSVTNGAEIGSDSSNNFGTDSGTLTISAGSIIADGAGLSEQPVSSIGSFANGTSGSLSLSVEGNVSVTNGARVISQGTDSGAVQISAANIAVSGENIGDQFSKLGSFSGHESAGTLGLTVTGTVAVSGGGEVASDAFLGSGINSGKVTVSAKHVNVSGTDTLGDSSLLGSRSGSGQAGDVLVQVTRGTIQVADGGQMGSFADSDGLVGQVQINASTVTVNGEDSPYSTGILVNGPIAPNSDPNTPVFAVSVNAQTLSALNGGLISTDAFGSSSAGNIDVTITGTARFSSQGGVEAVQYGGGSGGLVQIHAATLDMSDGIISASNFGSSSAGGTLSITATDVTLTDSSSITATATQGLTQPLMVTVNFASVPGYEAVVSLISPRGKQIELGKNVPPAPTTYSDDASTTNYTAAPIGSLASFTALDLNGIWKLQVQAPDQPDTPPVKLDAWSLSLGGQVIGSSTNVFAGLAFTSPLNVENINPAQTGGNGGIINFKSSGFVAIQNSQLTAKANDTGGNISIDPSLVVLQNGLLSASASKGNGGKVTLSGGQLLRYDTPINVSSTFGDPGTVLVNSSPASDLAGELLPLQSNLPNPSLSLIPACGEMAGSNVSSFVSIGNGGTAAEPGGLLPSFDSLDDTQKTKP
ncbi:MAG TPA: filamentous hemagglutinin N-terminal domain-containing protein [Tepidisphaeraceae bacterium]|jgi:filamentous hemagglutinin family protein